MANTKPFSESDRTGSLIIPPDYDIFNGTLSDIKMEKVPLPKDFIQFAKAKLTKEGMMQIGDYFKRRVLHKSTPVKPPFNLTPRGTNSIPKKKRRK